MKNMLIKKNIILILLYVATLPDMMEHGSPNFLFHVDHSSFSLFVKTPVLAFIHTCSSEKWF